MARVLIVDDDPVCTMFLSRFLVKDGHEVKTTTRGEEAIRIGGEWFPDILVADWLLKSEHDGVDVARGLHRLCPDMRIIFMTGLPADQLQDSLQGLPVLRVLEKPLQVDGLLHEIRAVLS